MSGADKALITIILIVSLTMLGFGIIGYLREKTNIDYCMNSPLDRIDRERCNLNK